MRVFHSAEFTVGTLGDMVRACDEVATAGATDSTDIIVKVRTDGRRPRQRPVIRFEWSTGEDRPREGCAAKV